jgi:hypothetical protein
MATGEWCLAPEERGITRTGWIAKGTKGGLPPVALTPAMRALSKGED